MRRGLTMLATPAASPGDVVLQPPPLSEQLPSDDAAACVAGIHRIWNWDHTTSGRAFVSVVAGVHAVGQLDTSWLSERYQLSAALTETKSGNQ